MALRVTEEPAAHCTLLSQFTWQLMWTPERDYPAGSQVELRSHCLRAFLSWRYVATLVARGDVVYRWKQRPSVSEMWRNRERVIVRARLPWGVRRGHGVPMTLTCIPPHYAGVDNQLAVWVTDPPSGMQADSQSPPARAEAGSVCCLRAVAGAVARLDLYCQPTPGPDGQVRTVISPQDHLGNPTQFRQPTTATLSWAGATQTLTLTGTRQLRLPPPPPGTARAVLRLALADLGPSENLANASFQGDTAEITSNPVWPGAPVGQRAAFGDIHWHTDFSGDGQRPIAEALRCAHEELNLDFAAPSDHSPPAAAWRETVAAVEAANAPDRFATLFGWESSTPQGHENLYFTRPDHPLVCGGSAGFKGGLPPEVAAKLAEHPDVLVVPHHTNAVSESRRLEDDAPFWHPYAWSEPTPVHRLAEVFQIRGNQESNAYSDAWRGWHQGHGASLQDALARGYRLGFTGGTDNHCGWPGRGFASQEGGSHHPPHSQFLTGVWTPRVARQEVFDSLVARRTWAVWDTRALVWFAINGVPMGGELRVAPGTPLRATLRLSVEAPCQVIALVTEGQEVWTGSFSALDWQQEIDLGLAHKSTHCYLRARLRTGGLIYASPVFIDLIA